MKKEVFEAKQDRKIPINIVVCCSLDAKGMVARTAATTEATSCCQDQRWLFCCGYKELQSRGAET